MPAPHEPVAAPRVGVAIATRERRAELEGVLERLLGLPERPPVVVADNGSRDGTPAAIRARFPAVEVIELGENRGAGARNAAVAALGTPYVAFSDDDSWWAPDALSRAAGASGRRSQEESSQLRSCSRCRPARSGPGCGWWWQTTSST